MSAKIDLASCVPRMIVWAADDQIAGGHEPWGAAKRPREPWRDDEDMQPGLSYRPSSGAEPRGHPGDQEACS